MEWYWAFAFLAGMVVCLTAVGVPVAFAFIITNFVGVLVFVGSHGLIQAVDNSTVSITRFTLGPAPMFILMGALFFRTGLAVRVFDGLDTLFGKLRGRLCYLAVAGGAVFSTLTGSSVANTSMLGSLLVPEMQRRGYDRRMSMGPIPGAGGLAMIIPPSALAVLLASVADIDVGRLLLSGFLPGFVLAVLYAAMLYLQILVNPAGAPACDAPPTSRGRKLKVVCFHILPVSLVVFMVVGSIVLGGATPTESAACGVLGVSILAAAFRVLKWEAVRTSLSDTVRVAGMMFFIVMNSTVFSQLLIYSGATAGMMEWAIGFEGSSLDALRIVVLSVMFLILIVLGMFMDAASVMLITVPVFFPLVEEVLALDLVWFGLFVLMTLKMAGAAPPFGLLLHVTLGAAPRGTTLLQAANAAFPFLVCDLILIGILMAYPQLALFLPDLMQ